MRKGVKLESQNCILILVAYVRRRTAYVCGAPLHQLGNHPTYYLPIPIWDGPIEIIPCCLLPLVLLLRSFWNSDFDMVMPGDAGT